MTRQLSTEGINLLKELEGCRLTAYLDDSGVWTIGIGHTRGVKRGDRCTMEQATAFLLSDIQVAENSIEGLVKVDLTQNEFDALAIWEYNTGGLKGSTALKLLNAGDYEGCCEQMQRWIYTHDPGTGQKVRNNGLMNRRAKEALLWHKDWVDASNGSATPTPPPSTVTATTTGKTAIAGIVTSVGAASTMVANVLSSGTSAIQPAADAVHATTGLVQGFSGYPEIVVGLLVGLLVILNLYLLIHQHNTIGSASQ